jgi:hypothetical protein
MQKGKYKGNKGAPERGRNIFSEGQRGVWLLDQNKDICRTFKKAHF